MPLLCIPMESKEHTYLFSQFINSLKGGIHIKKRRYLLTLSITILVTAALVFFLTQPKGIEHYEKLLSQQDYGKARLGLEKELRNKPDWQEARVLLAKVELAAGEPLAALEQFTALWHLGWQDESLEDSFVSLCNRETSISAIAYLKEKEASLPRARTAVNLAMNADSPTLMEDTLPWLHMFITKEKLLFNKALSWLQEKSPITTWRICGQLDYRLQIELANELYSKGKLEQLIPQLIAANNSSLLAIVDFATELEGENGLALLKTLEELGYTAEDKKAYQETKLTMLFQAGPLPVEPSLFSGIEKSRLLDLAESWAQVAVSYIESQDNESEGYDIKPVVALLDHLKQDKAYHNQVAILEKILSPLPSPAPTRTVDLTEFGEKYWDFLSVSPDGRHILYNEGGEEETTYWYNIIQKKHVATFPFFSTAVWDPHSDNLALYSLGDSSKFFFFRSNSPKVISESAKEETTNILGWHANKLYVYRPVENEFLVETINPQSGERQLIRNLPYPPSLSVQGELGYLVEEGHSIKITLGDKIMSFPAEHGEPWEIKGWFPGDEGVFLLQGQKYFILKFADGILTPLPLGYLEPQTLCWLDNNRVLCTYENNSDLGVAVIVLNTDNMSLTHTNIYAYRNQMIGKMVSSFGNEKLKIHILQ